MSLSSFFQPIYRLKELYRQGWIGKVPSSEIESVAEHSFAVANLALVLVPIENHLRREVPQNYKELNNYEILAKCLVHDLPESQYLDLDRTFPSILGKEMHQDFKSKLDEAAENRIQENFNNFTKKVFSIELKNLMPNMNAKTNEEDEFVKLLDVLELLLQARVYLDKKFISEENARSFIIGTKEKLASFKKKFLIIEYLLNKEE